MQSAIGKEEKDPQHNWVWGLGKGEKVWVAIEEPLATTERFSIDFLDEVGPEEFESTSEIFMPYEMEVVNNWTLKSGDEESHIIALKFSGARARRSLRFACQCKHPDLCNFFISRRSERNVVSTHIFRTKEECAGICADFIAQNYTVDRCAVLLKALSQINRRIQGVRKICAESEAEMYGDLDFASAVEHTLD